MTIFSVEMKSVTKVNGGGVLELKTSLWKISFFLENGYGASHWRKAVCGIPSFFASTDRIKMNGIQNLTLPLVPRSFGNVYLPPILWSIITYPLSLGMETVSGLGLMFGLVIPLSLLVSLVFSELLTTKMPLSLNFYPPLPMVFLGTFYLQWIP